MGLKIVTLRIKTPAVLHYFAVSRLATTKVSAEPAIEFALDILSAALLKFISHQGVIKSTRKIPRQKGCDARSFLYSFRHGAGG